MISDQMQEHYRAVLRDLEQRQLACRKELDELEQTVISIRKLLPPPAQGRTIVPAAPLIHPNGTGKYEGISVRWAVLNLLAEDAARPMPTGEIASALIKGGVRPGGKNFTSNVSAVLSTMANTRNEIEQSEGNYKMTAHGREVWEAIKVSERYRNRSVSAT